MTDYVLPNTLKFYFGLREDIQPSDVDARQEAVDALVAVLDGQSPDKHKKKALVIPESPANLVWDTMKQYNVALSAAAQTRADYIDLMFQIWERTFGDAGARNLGQEWYNPTVTVHEMWNLGYVSLDIYRNGSPDDGGSSDGFFVEWLEDNHFSLIVKRWKKDGEQVDFKGDLESKNWKIDKDPDDKDHKCAIMRKAVRIDALGTDFTAALGKAPEAAREMVEFLRNNVL